MADIKKARIFLRRGTDASRLGTELCEGELGYSTDGTRVFVGDGSTLGGNSLGATVFILPAASGADPDTAVTTLTAASADGRAEVGDFAFIPASSYSLSTFNPHVSGDIEDVISTPDETFGTLYVLSARDSGDGALTWVVANSGIPISHIDIPDNSIAADKIHGGNISGELTLSDHITSLSSVTLSGVAADAPQSTGVVELSSGVVYPLGITHTSLVTAASSIFDLGYYAQRGLSDFIPLTANKGSARWAITQELGFSTSYGTNVVTEGTLSNGGDSWEGDPTAIDHGRNYSPTVKYKLWGLNSSSGVKGILELVDTSVYGSFTWEQIEGFYVKHAGSMDESGGVFAGYYNYAAAQKITLAWHVEGVEGGKDADKNPFETHHYIPNAWAPGTASADKRLKLYVAGQGRESAIWIYGIKVKR